jgi:hypothetical protein
VPQQKLAVDVTVGDLFVVVYLVVAVIFLARHWTVSAEDEFDGESPEQNDRPATPAPERYASDFGRTYPTSVAQPGASSDHSHSSESVARAPVGNLR